MGREGEQQAWPLGCPEAAPLRWFPLVLPSAPPVSPQDPEAEQVGAAALSSAQWALSGPRRGPSGLSRLPVLATCVPLPSRQFSSQPLSLSLSSPALPSPNLENLACPPQVPLIMSLPFSGPFHVRSVFGDEVADPESRTPGEDSREPPGSPARSVAPLPRTRFLLLPPSPCVRVSLPVTSGFPWGPQAEALGQRAGLSWERTFQPGHFCAPTGAARSPCAAPDAQ